MGQMTPAEMDAVLDAHYKYEAAAAIAQQLG